MATQPTKYVNNNPFPIYLPDQRGGQVMFRPGEGTTKQWFSRLCGHRQLTRIGPNELRPNSMIGKPVLHREVQISDQVVDVPAPIQQPQRPTQSFQDLSTAEYILKNGIYSCRLCDQFKTGSSLSMKAHIQEYHMRKTEVEKPEPKYGQDEHEGEKLTVTSKASASQFITKEDEEKTEVNIRSTPKVEPVQPPAQPVQQEVSFQCQKPGCGKSFRTKRALSMHDTRMHK